MTRVRALDSIILNGREYHAGSEFDVPADLADSLAARKLAEPVVPARQSRPAAVPSAAVSKPRAAEPKAPDAGDKRPG